MACVYPVGWLSEILLCVMSRRVECSSHSVQRRTQTPESLRREGLIHLVSSADDPAVLTCYDKTRTQSFCAADLMCVHLQNSHLPFLLLIRLVRLPEQRCWLKCRLHLHPDKLDSCLHHVVVQDASSPCKRFIVNSVWPPWEQIKLPAAADPTVGQQKTFWFWFSPAALTVQDDRRVGETAQWVSDLSVPVYKWFTAMINHFRQKWKWK